MCDSSCQNLKEEMDLCQRMGITARDGWECPEHPSHEAENCPRVAMRMECLACDYPMSEARYV